MPNFPCQLSVPLTPGVRIHQPKTSTPQSSADSQVVSGSRSTDSVDAKQQLTDTKNALKELQDQFNTYKREKADNDRYVDTPGGITEQRDRQVGPEGGTMGFVGCLMRVWLFACSSRKILVVILAGFVV